MRQRQYTLTPRQVQAHATQLLTKHLRLRDHGPKTTATTVLSVLFYAAARLISLAACAALVRVPTDQAIHDALLAVLPDLDQLQVRLNRALAGDLPQGLRRRSQPLAIDLFLVPYHGQPLHDAAEIYRSKPKGGTSHFHADATAYGIRQGQRFTLALTYVRGGEALKDVVQRLLRQVARLGIQASYMLVDRGFWSVDVGAGAMPLGVVAGASAAGWYRADGPPPTARGRTPARWVDTRREIAVAGHLCGCCRLRAVDPGRGTSVNGGGTGSRSQGPPSGRNSG